VVHNSLYYRLYGEGLPADALKELSAEPLAATCFPPTVSVSLLHELGIADVEVCIIHKLLVARPHGPLSLFASLHRPLFVLIKKVDLLHCWEIDDVVGRDHDIRHLFFFFFTVGIVPQEGFVFNGDGCVILVELPVWITVFPNLA